MSIKKEGHLFKNIRMIRRKERLIRGRKDSSHLSSRNTLKNIIEGRKHKVNLI